MSNELNTPKTLFCPAEYDTTRRSAATTFALVPIRHGWSSGIPGQHEPQLFVGSDANDTTPSCFWRVTITWAKAILPGIQNVYFNAIKYFQTNSPVTDKNNGVGWTTVSTPRAMVLFGDNSAQGSPARPCTIPSSARATRATTCISLEVLSTRLIFKHERASERMPFLLLQDRFVKRYL